MLVGNAILPDLATHPFTRTVFAGGASGVDLFFVLSGYLLYRPFANRDLGDGVPVDLRRYGVNRVVRIVPLYLATLAIVLIVNHRGGTLREWLIMGTFSGNFAFADVGQATMPVSWSL